MSSCVVPANQPIYEALIKKANSYPSTEPYKAKAYTKAATSIAAHTNNIYDELVNDWWYSDGLSGIGWGITMFINEFIKTNPRTNLTLIDHYNQLILDSKPVQYITENPQSIRSATAGTAGLVRRSNRLKGKVVKYYESDDDDDVNDSEDDSDETYVDESDAESDTASEEEDEVTRAIKSICAKNAWPYSDDLVTDYKAWYPTKPYYQTHNYNYDTQAYDTPRKTEVVVKTWAREYSTKLKPFYRMTAMKLGLIKYCKRHGYEHNEKLAKKFAEWASDPANTTRVYAYVGGGRYVYEYPPATAVTKWFKTLKKMIVF
jgi:hypothetical protein